MTNLIVCCDGTWNTPDQKQNDLPAPTNVVKLFNALAATDLGGVEQKRYYHPGVGTDGGFLDQLTGGGMGDGLDRNIQSAYKWLATTYATGDRIFLFGFSRGAFTVRSLAGMISRCGLLRLAGAALEPGKIWTVVDAVFKCYRNKIDYAAPTGLTLCDAVASSKGPAIHFLGVWDTVGALGIPDDLALLNLLDRSKHEFHDTALGPAVQNARHAVALDERRQSFTPTLWTNLADRPTAKQIWFPGVHCDVGGGYSRTGLSDAALLWMIEEAEACRLAFRPNVKVKIAPDPQEALHDSDTGVFEALRSLPRSAPNVEAAANAGLIHRSGVDRHADPPLFEAAYWPTRVLAAGESCTIDVFAREKWNASGVYLEAGNEYSLTATGEWLDATMKCTPEGAGHDGKFRIGKFRLGEIAQLAGSAVGEMETLFRSKTGNEQADFLWTKREENFDWFALIGVIANGSGADLAGNPIPHQTFMIGSAARVKPTIGGYLYCFANDAWQAYDNNKGSVSLTISRSV
jgi:uncharacterized protein (DUF2235 family)